MNMIPPWFFGGIILFHRFSKRKWWQRILGENEKLTNTIHFAILSLSKNGLLFLENSWINTRKTINLTIRADHISIEDRKINRSFNQNTLNPWRTDKETHRHSDIRTSLERNCSLMGDKLLFQYQTLNTTGPEAELFFIEVWF